MSTYVINLYKFNLQAQKCTDFVLFTFNANQDLCV